MALKRLNESLHKIQQKTSECFENLFGAFITIKSCMNAITILIDTRNQNNSKKCWRFSSLFTERKWQRRGKVQKLLLIDRCIISHRSKQKIAKIKSQARSIGERSGNNITNQIQWTTTTTSTAKSRCWDIAREKKDKQIKIKAHPN